MAEITVTLSGPIFAAGMTPRVQQAIHKGMLQSALLGQLLVHQQLYPGHGVKTGNFRRSVVGEAGVWHTGTVDSPLNYKNWLETGQRNGKQTRFAGYQMFERAAERLANRRLAEVFIGAVMQALEDQ